MSGGIRAERHHDTHNAGPYASHSFGAQLGWDLLFWPDGPGKVPVEDLATKDAIRLDIQHPDLAHVYDGRKSHEMTSFAGDVSRSSSPCERAATTLNKSSSFANWSPRDSASRATSRISSRRRNRLRKQTGFSSYPAKTLTLQASLLTHALILTRAPQPRCNRGFVSTKKRDSSWQR